MNFFKEIERRRWMIAYAVPTVAALLARGVAWTTWLGSPFRYYHHVLGLDTHGIVNNVQRFMDGKISFNLYRGLAAVALWLVPDLDAAVVVLVLVNYVLGVGTALFVAHACRRLFGDWRIALLGGLLCGCYGPLVMYESFTLRESLYLFTLAMSLTLVLTLRKRRGTTLFLLGMVLATPVMTRPSGLAWAIAAVGWLSLYWARRSLRRGENAHRLCVNVGRRTTAVGCGLVFVLTISLVGNYLYCGEWMYGSRYFSFMRSALLGKRQVRFDMAKRSAPSSHQSEESSNATIVKFRGDAAEGRLSRYLLNAGKAVSAFETPNNLNWYFIRDLLPPIRYLVGPALLLPLAWAGLVTWLCRWRFTGRESLVLFFFCSCMVPLIVYVPVARYRLALLPALTIVAADFIVTFFRAFVRPRNGKRLTGLAMAAAYLFILSWVWPRDPFVRRDDLYALAVAADAGNMDKRLREACYRGALRFDPGHAPSIRGLANLMLLSQRFHDASKLIDPLYRRNPRNWKNALCRAAALLGTGESETAERVLLEANEPDRDEDRANVLYFLGETRRTRGRLDEAASDYREALSLNVSRRQRMVLRQALLACGRNGEGNGKD